ncbi:MAG: FAD-dependent oxidoreductase [Bacillota bacterium]
MANLQMPAAESYDLVIIGGGPGGATAALYAARAELRTLVLDKSLSAGALGMTGRVDNYPGMPRSSGPEIVRTIRGAGGVLRGGLPAGAGNGRQPGGGGEGDLLRRWRWWAAGSRRPRRRSSSPGSLPR